MPDIILSTLNARYAHAAFGLRYLMANLAELQDRARILEFDINQRPLDILEQILAHRPRIVGFGVYIWNVAPTTQLVADLKRLRPDITVVLGGPEVSHEIDEQQIVSLADYVLTGEADLSFADLCRNLLRGNSPPMKILPAVLPEFESKESPQRRIGVTEHQGRGVDRGRTPILRHPDAPSPSRLNLPYHLYDDQDIQHRVIYVEASRGCPFRCEFCLSSLDVPVRNVPLETFLPAMQDLLDRGVRHFKFVDRTFNLNLTISTAILQFFLARYQPGLFLHFEMIPDRLPEPLRELIRQFPLAALQFEVGIQTFNEDVAKLISRRQDNTKVEENFRFLRQETGVHIHADLIAGLPGENLPSFAAGFDRLVALAPQEIQLGILKRLRGTPIARHTQQWGMVYSPQAPYEVLETKLIDFPTMQRIRRFARYWDLVSNSGNFLLTAPLIWADASPFDSFLRFSDWLYARTGQRTHGIALNHLAELLFEYLTEELRQDPGQVASAMLHDLHRTGRKDSPDFLRPHLPEPPLSVRSAPPLSPPRQSRHRAE